MRAAGPEDRPRSAARADAGGDVPGRARPVRPVRRPLRARDAGARARAARARRARHPAATRSSRPSSSRELRDLGRPADGADARARTVAAAGARKSGSSARTSRTPARTRSTTRSARRCSRSGSARSASSPRPVPASMAWPRPRPARASACPASVYMGAVDMERQAPNVGRMKLLGADGRARDQRRPDAARRHRRGVARLGRRTRTARSTCSARRSGPHPYPLPGARAAVRDRRRGARADARAQAGALPDVVVACVGGGSNAIGLFHPFLGDAGVEAPRRRGGRHAARGSGRTPRARLRHARRAAGLLLAAAAGRGRPDPGNALGVRRPRLSGRRPRARAAREHRARRVRGGRPTTSRSRRWPSAARPKASCPRIESAHAFAGAKRWAQRESRAAAS